jgi:predicted metal-dependent RNase
MLTLDDYMHSGSLPHIPIYTDGMINKALRIHRHNVIYCREELQKRILMSEDDPFKSKNFFDVTSNQMRRKIMNSQESCIIVTTSGMLNGGPVLRYLERLGRYTENKMMLVGYQVEGTRGRDLQDGKKELDINGRKVPVNLEVETYHLSAHADRQQLERFVESINGLENIFIVHGEPAKSRQFNDALKEKYKTHLPRIGEQFTL